MKKILYIYPKHLNTIKFFKKISLENKKGNFIFVDQKNKKKIFKEIVNSNALINCPRAIFKEAFKNAKNLADDQYMNAIRSGSNAQGGQLYASFTDPRSWGIQFGSSF